MTTTKTGHTPGRLEAVELGIIAEKITSHGNFYVCSLIEPDNDEDKANARRLAAAWNATEGIETEVLECLKPGALPALLASRTELVEALRDAEFLLRKLAINWKEAGSMKDSCARCAEDARAALAKATGEGK